MSRQRGHFKPAAYNSMDIAWRIRVQPRWGHVAIGDIKPTAVQQWVADLSKGTGGAKASGASVIIHAHRVLSGILNDAVNDNLLARNPAKGIRLPRVTRKRPVYMTHQQVSDLATVVGEFEGLVLTLAYTGLRWGEVIGLRVRDLDMLRRRPTISENAGQVNNTIHVGTSKAHKLRTVPLRNFCCPISLANARVRVATICCSPAMMVAIGSARTLNMAGSSKPSPHRSCRA